MKHWRYKALLLGSIVSVLLLQACGTAGLYKPPGKGPFPAVIVLHTSGGIQDYLVDFAIDLSREGYVTMVVHYLSGPGRNPDVIEKELQIIVNAYDELKALPIVDPKRIGMVGFSLGGNRALVFAANKPDRKIRGIVSYFIGCFRCGNQYPQFEFPPVLFLHGELDDRTAPAKIERYCDNLRIRIVGYDDCKFHFYKGVYHNFLRLAYNAFAEADAFKRAVAFLDKHVKGKSK